ncbi:MAG TPA: molybdenum cofactor biosynthesis protein MoaE [Terracidiphilus sp.]|nr:molybdenum cofactor biosynthesis protein MoaE [Terracidiphilus sp.]
MLLDMIQVRVQAYGVLKDALGGAASTWALEEGATVGDLMARLGERSSAMHFRGIAVAVNAEYAEASQVLRENDEVALLPPVSGGSTGPEDGAGAGVESVCLTHEPIAAEKLIAEVKRGEDGAVVVFDGIVRNHSRGRATLYLDYEAYEEMARKQMNLLVDEARERFGVRHVTIVHRLGRLAIGETSVLIVVASAHRAQAFDACRWVIDTLKKTVPIWKRETFADGAVWAAGEPFPAGMSLEGADGV